MKNPKIILALEAAYCSKKVFKLRSNDNE